MSPPSPANAAAPSDETREAIRMLTELREHAGRAGAARPYLSDYFDEDDPACVVAMTALDRWGYYGRGGSDRARNVRIIGLALSSLGVSDA